MNTKNIKTETLCLIDRYFDGQSSLEEERRLRLLLADPRLHGEEIDQARAVIGLSAAADMAHGRKRMHMRRRLIATASVAASVIVALTISFCLFRPSDPKPVMTAYIGGKPTSDHRIINDLVESDLAIIASAEADNELMIDSELNLFNELTN